MVGDRGQVAVMAAIGDLVDADRDEPLEAALIEPVGDDALDDRADRVPPDPEQPRDRRERHLLGQPRDQILKVARVCGADPRPWDGLQAHAAVRASESSQLALDRAAAGAEIEVPPALDPAVMDLQRPGLPAAAADAPATPQPNRHEHAVVGKRDVRHAGAGQAQQALECGADPHVALLGEPLAVEQPAACRQGGGGSLAFRASSEELLSGESPAQAVNAAPDSPPSRTETPHSWHCDRFAGYGADSRRQLDWSDRGELYPEVVDAPEDEGGVP